jgi:hypothetical protein
MASARVLSILLIAILLIPNVGAQSQEERDYISRPGNIPLLSNFSTPQLEPGETGQLKFSLTNRYNNSITDVVLTIEIYEYANIHRSKDIQGVDGRPRFRSTLDQSNRLEWAVIEPEEEKVKDDIYIETFEGTEQGTYFVMFSLEFDYAFSNDSRHNITMKSRGYFTEEEWQSAIEIGTDEDPGYINITNLGVHGIIPDTTFGVKKPWPIWPLYVLGGLTVFFAVMAILSYMYEENTHPRFTRMVHRRQRQLGEQREIILHELGKFRKKK